MYKTAEATFLFTRLRLSRKVFQKCLLLVPLHSCCPDTKGSLINQRQICLGFAQSFLLMSRHKNASHMCMSRTWSRTWQRLIFTGLLANMSNEPLFLKKTPNQTNKQKRLSSELSEKFSIWFFISLLGELAGTTDFNRSSNVTADILIYTQDVAHVTKSKVQFEVKEQNKMALFTVLCKTSAV